MMYTCTIKIINHIEHHLIIASYCAGHPAIKWNFTGGYCMINLCIICKHPQVTLNHFW